MTTTTERLKVVVRGAVQGVGFRPFVYRLARELSLTGWVLNSSQGVFLEVEGPGAELRQFLLRLETEKPPRAIIQSLESSFLDAVGHETFEIRYSDDAGAKTVLILPDIAPCVDCLREMADPADRRHRYPFINCTNCGPRFSIIEALPYDRAHTSMKAFTMCPACDRDYHDPLDRRFHAQPNACPACGPQLELWDATGKVLASRDDALRAAAEKIRGGEIVALKGVGGFQLLADARNEWAMRRLRERKRREEKPFAVMYPHAESAAEDCEISDLERRLLTSAEAPIVLLRRRPLSALATGLAPANPNLGVMLPSSPLHHLLLGELGFPVVATSGNLSDEPICIDEHEALTRLAGLADFLLVHNRPIVRHVDDSIVRVVRDREMVLRRARGYAPLPLHRATPMPCVLAVGAHLKNSVALSVGREIFLSQHIGDLETSQAHDAFRRVIADLQRLYDVTPDFVACDLHPDYLSTRHAAQLGAPLVPVQHHWAHVLSCLAENEIDGPALGVAWDGTGYGLDGTIWGGEFLRANEDGSFTRAAHLRTFRLPGGEAAVRQPCRTALGLFFECDGNAFRPSPGGRRLPGSLESINGKQHDLAPLREFGIAELSLIQQMLAKGVQSPVTSSAGRLFDAVAALLGIRQHAHFEGQAAMELEFAVRPGVEIHYDFKLRPGEPAILDWQPMIAQILDELARREEVGTMAAKFHNTLAEMIVAVARQVGENRVALTGGCFQNRYLLERTIRRLIETGFRPCWHQRVPANDGGIALGQAMAAVRQHERAQRAEASA
jgi:hydrogenase maturation protein HypF